MRTTQIFYTLPLSLVSSLSLFLVFSDPHSLSSFFRTDKPKVPLNLGDRRYKEYQCFREDSTSTLVPISGKNSFVFTLKTRAPS